MRLTISFRVYTGFGLVIALGAALAGYGDWQLSNISTSAATARPLTDSLKMRFVEIQGGAAYLQLPLNHEHLGYMTQILAKFRRAAA
jgi:hypothetical protein